MKKPLVSLTAKLVKHPDGAILARIAESVGAGKYVVKVGYPATPDRTDGTSSAQIAAVHEYGYPDGGIPERPFLRPSLRAGVPDQIKLNKRNLLAVVAGKMSLLKALGQLGVMAVGQVQAYITDGHFEPLKAATVAAKGSSKPLIDSGQMRADVKSVVEGKL